MTAKQPYPVPKSRLSSWLAQLVMSTKGQCREASLRGNTNDIVDILITGVDIPLSPFTPPTLNLC